MLCLWACSDLEGTARRIFCPNADPRRRALVNSIRKYYLLTAASHCSDQFPLTFIQKWFTVWFVVSSTSYFISQEVNKHTDTHTHTTAADQRPALTSKSMSDKPWLFFFPAPIVSVFVCTESIILWCFVMMKVGMFVCLCVCVCTCAWERHEGLSVY